MICPYVGCNLIDECSTLLTNIIFSDVEFYLFELIARDVDGVNNVDNSV